MLPEPLHPAIVHFPIVLAILLPIAALGAWWVIRRGGRPAAVWAVALAVSAWVAVETGEHEEERVESVVAESVLHAHEEAGARFLILSGVLVLVMAGGLLSGTLGTAARAVGTLGAAGLVILIVQVGAAGGEMVYAHGAASAYASPGGVGAGPPARAVPGVARPAEAAPDRERYEGEHEEHEDDD
jgi:uncharacterized membrane protein